MRLYSLHNPSVAIRAMSIIVNVSKCVNTEGRVTCDTGVNHGKTQRAPRANETATDTIRLVGQAVSTSGGKAAKRGRKTAQAVLKRGQRGKAVSMEIEGDQDGADKTESEEDEEDEDEEQEQEQEREKEGKEEVEEDRQKDASEIIDVDEDQGQEDEGVQTHECQEFHEAGGKKGLKEPQGNKWSCEMEEMMEGREAREHGIEENVKRPAKKVIFCHATC